MIGSKLLPRLYPVATLRVLLKPLSYLRVIHRRTNAQERFSSIYLRAKGIFELAMTKPLRVWVSRR